MASKYDHFWASRRDALSALVDRAARGVAAELEVSEIRGLGNRRSWYGSALVRGREVVRSQMAHVTALARLVASWGLCEREPTTAFTFAVSADGRRLSVRAGPSASRGVSQVQEESSQVDSGLSPRVPGRTDTTAMCAILHRVLADTPAMSVTTDVTFADGLYVFYEYGETSSHAPEGRIVRVGNHPRREGGLVPRLEMHYSSRPNAKNWSVFRRYLGGALLRRGDPTSGCLAPGPGQGHWEKQGGMACDRCATMEAAVTDELVSRFRFRCVPVPDREERNELEKRLIATLAQCEVCRPSSGWLGLSAYPESVRRTGLWNHRHVEERPLSPGELERVITLTARNRLILGEDASRTLLIVPCSAGKKGRHDIGLAPRRIDEFLSPESIAVLQEGRTRAFRRTGNWIDRSSQAWPALGRYSGQPYRTGDVRAGLANHVRAGGHCLILSGGYGLIRPEEPIHEYEAPMSRTSGVWNRRLGAVLRDYVARHRIRRTFAAFSRTYASTVPDRLADEDWRAIPQVEGMSAVTRVPSEVGRLFDALLKSHLGPTAGWRSE
jgi:hypothetical protein